MSDQRGREVKMVSAARADDVAQNVRHCGSHTVEALPTGERNNALPRAVHRGLHRHNLR